MNDNNVARCWNGNAEVWARHVRAGYDTYRNLYELKTASTSNLLAPLAPHPLSPLAGVS